MSNDIDQVVDEIIDILGYETWKEVGAFMENLTSAMHLPVEPTMWWALNSRTKTARILQDHNTVSSANGATLEEAVCRAWLQWKTAPSDDGGE